MTLLIVAFVLLGLLVLIGRAIFPLIISNMKTKSVHWGLGSDIKLTELKKPVTYVVDLQGKAQQSAALRSLLVMSCTALIIVCVVATLLWLTTEGLAQQTQEERQKALLAAQQKVDLEQTVLSLQSERDQLSATLREREGQISQLQSTLNERQAELTMIKSTQSTDQIPVDLAIAFIVLTIILVGSSSFFFGYRSGSHTRVGAGRTRQNRPGLPPEQNRPSNRGLPPPRLIGARSDARARPTNSQTRTGLTSSAPKVVPGQPTDAQLRDQVRSKRADATIVAAAWAIVAALFGTLIMTGVVSGTALLIGVDDPVTRSLDVGVSLYIITGSLIAALTFVGLRSYMLRQTNTNNQR